MLPLPQFLPSMKDNKEMTLGATFGVAVGSLIGVLTGIMALWISLGIAIGAGVGFVLANREKESEDS